MQQPPAVHPVLTSPKTKPDAAARLATLTNIKTHMIRWRKRSHAPEFGGTTKCWPLQRKKLAEFLEAPRVQHVIIGLIVLDLLVVITELMLDAFYPDCEDGTAHHVPHAVHDAEHALHIISLVILFILATEVIGVFCAFLLDFFRHPFFVLDAVVVGVALLFDLGFKKDVGGLLLFIRLWRIVRIMHGVYMGMHEHVERIEEHIHELESASNHWELEAARWHSESYRLTALVQEYEAQRLQLQQQQQQQQQPASPSKPRAYAAPIHMSPVRPAQGHMRMAADDAIIAPISSLPPQRFAKTSPNAPMDSANRSVAFM